jgi:hypothetical protein
MVPCPLASVQDVNKSSPICGYEAGSCAGKAQARTASPWNAAEGSGEGRSLRHDKTVQWWVVPEGKGPPAQEEQPG